VPLLQQIGIRAWILSGWENLSGYVYVSFRSIVQKRWSTVHWRYCSPNAVIVQKRWSTVHRSGALFIGCTVYRTLLLFIWYCSLTLFIEYCSPALYTGTVHRTLLLFIWYCSLNTVYSTVHWHCTRVLFQNYGKESSVNRQHCCLRRLGFKWDRCDPSSLSWELS
jgi:hypothetical protein